MSKPNNKRKTNDSSTISNKSAKLVGRPDPTGRLLQQQPVGVLPKPNPRLKNYFFSVDFTIHWLLDSEIVLVLRPNPQFRFKIPKNIATTWGKQFENNLQGLGLKVFRKFAIYDKTIGKYVQRLTNGKTITVTQSRYGKDKNKAYWEPTIDGYSEEFDTYVEVKAEHNLITCNMWNNNGTRQIGKFIVLKTSSQQYNELKHKNGEYWWKEFVNDGKHGYYRVCRSHISECVLLQKSNLNGGGRRIISWETVRDFCIGLDPKLVKKFKPQPNK